MRSTRPNGIHPSKKTRRAAALALAAFPLGGAFLASACLDRPICDDCSPRTTNIFVEAVDPKTVAKIDLLFMIDNSSSMADKQQVLAAAVPDLVGRLVKPNCVVKDTGEIKPREGDNCPAGAPQEFEPVGDIHIGVITSSLGAHGANNYCADTSLEEVNDHAHLLGTRPRFLAANVAGGPAPLLDPKGFLNWNPHDVPGQTVDSLTYAFQVMTKKAGENGCGYEAQLESIYHFLADPAPYATVGLTQCAGGGQCAVPQGLDQDVLDERALFLRPDSLVAVIMLTDENDCSMRDGGQAYFVGQDNQLMWKGSSACAQNPNDHCCYSCGVTKIPDGCQPDPSCGKMDSVEDDTNLRCWNQQQRFGFDFLYPTSRYVSALRHRQLCTSRLDLDATDPSQCPDIDGKPGADVVTNPLFAGGRNPDLVFLAGVLGVPWQDIQTDKKPDGTDYPAGELHYMTADQLKTEKIWDRILGSPKPGGGAPPILPTDGLMVESSYPRAGNDMNGKLIAGPNATTATANAMNGHDWDAHPSDLEYACIFRLPPDEKTGQLFRTCAPDDDSCDCSDLGLSGRSPLCQNPQTGEYSHDQYFAKAYPGLRELSVLKDFGDNAIVASICAKNLDPIAKDALVPQDYGYRPAVDALVDRLKDQLAGRCLPRRLEKDAEGKYPCGIIEASPGNAGCDPSRGRIAPRPGLIGPTEDRLAEIGFCGGPDQPSCSSMTLCELKEAGAECHKDQDDQPTPGWCYVDPDSNPTDDANLVSNCPATRRRTIRFVDPLKLTPAPNSRVIIACAGADLAGSP